MNNKPLFIEIKEYYQQLIDIGVYKPGQEMPSIREVALEKNANPNTVQRAFSLMVEEGYLEVKPKKGFYVKNRDEEPVDYLKNKLLEILNSGYDLADIIKKLKEINHDCD